MKKKGFTLVELLAVIVILAVILVIAVPKVMDTIQNSKEGTLMSSAKLIAGQAEKKYVENQVLGINDIISCDDVAKTTDDYDYCDISFDNDGKATVTISGKGKFDGMAVCNGTKTEASISDNCYTDEDCFRYQGEILNIEIDEVACNEYFKWHIWGTPGPDDITLFCNGMETSSGYTLIEEIKNGNESITDLKLQGVITKIEYGDEIEITGYNSSCSPNVWVPEKIDNKKVIGIGVEAFNFNVWNIGGGGFGYSESQNNVMQLNNSLRPIDYECWSPGLCMNYKITNIRFPNTIEYISNSAFEDNNISGTLDLSNLTNLRIIDSWAFYNNNISSLILPNSSAHIGSNAFYGNSLTSITFGSPNITFDECALGYNELLENIYPENYSCR